MKQSLRFLLIMQAMLATAATADAQQVAKRPKVGFLLAGSAQPPSPFVQAFESGLRDLGWLKDQNVIVEYRYAEGKPERFPDLVDELIRLPVDVIVAGPAPAAMVAKKATATIPIVITLGLILLRSASWRRRKAGTSQA
jgi:putative ABC transport system substrate-binding protein